MRLRARLVVERMTTEALWKGVHSELNSLRDMTIQGADRSELPRVYARLEVILAELELRGVQLALFPG